MPDKDLIRVRSGLISVITKVENMIEAISDEEKNLMSYKMNMETQQSIVSSTLTKYEVTQGSIIELQDTPEKIDLETSNLKAFTERCQQLLIKLNHLIQEAPGQSEDSFKASFGVPESIMNFMMSSLRQSEQRHQQQMDLLLSTISKSASTPCQNPDVSNHALRKLPNMNLPTFDGKFGSWMSFKDRFTASVINYPGISNVQKLEYLQGAVKGDAAVSIKNLPTTDSNFLVAWQILIDKFEKKNEIISEHVRSFFAMPKIGPSNANAIHEITNTASACIMALDAMSITSRDPWLIQYVLDRLDSESRVLWGRECKSEVPTLKQFLAFLDQRCADNKNSSQNPNKTTTNTSNVRSNVKSISNSKKSAAALTTSANSTDSTNACRCCQESFHPLYKCQKFLNLSPEERFQTVKQLGLCRNCFSTHLTATCSYRKCQKCQAKHNVLLHDKFVSSTEGRTESQSTSNANSSNTTNTSTSTSSTAPTVLAVYSGHETVDTEAPPKVFLATALVNIFTSNGDYIPCRVVLDGAAQVNIMTNNLYEQLNLPKHPTRISICGVNANRNRVKFYVNATIASRTSDVSFSFKAFVLPKVSDNIPNWKVDTSSITVPSHIPLADPTWSQQQPVDLLLCGNPYWASWLSDVIELGSGLPMLKETVFGYVVVGEHEPIPPSESEDYYSLNTTALNESLRRFWELEKVPEEDSVTDDHLLTEHHFASTYARSPEGRFVVKLPFKEDPKVLGDSRPLAVRQLLALERRFEKNPNLRQLYKEVMNEQLRNKWIEPVPEDSRYALSYYMPHHGVLKDSTTTKLRVVFNASAKSSTGVSLNNLLRVGPTVQPKLITILLRFRRHRFAMTADIAKMYLQLLMDSTDANFQRFVWRNDKSQPIQDFRVTRVCFGVTCSPFLATRALLQLARDHQISHPLASEALNTSFYVDDCIYSTNSLDSALQTRAQLIELLSSGGFQLAKWSGNHPKLITGDGSMTSDTHFGDPTTKTLGLRWNSSSDSFRFAAPITPDDTCTTKRQMASAIARLFDPIGLIGPIIVEAKILLQEAHRDCKSWDAPLPQEIISKWQIFVNNLQSVDRVTIPRWISSIDNPTRMELHLFSDASQSAYGSVAYVVTYDSDGNVCSRVLTAKSRVAPMEPTTIPRLELCGALLASELADSIIPIYQPQETFFWCDSMVVLYWIHSPAENYKLFIAHRLRGIQSRTSSNQWRHVRTHDNPADIISRGATPLQLSESSIWWSGPAWLQQHKDSWPPVFTKSSSDPDVTVLAVTSNGKSHETILDELLQRFSTLAKITRVMRNCRRLIYRKSGRPSDTEEMELALGRLIYLDQSQHLPGLRSHLEKYGTIKDPKWKRLLALSPFVDSSGLIRVGGRLSNSNESFSCKFPILLPKSKLTDLIIEREHERQLHAGPSLLLACLRQRYWPLDGRNATRKIFRRCYRCNRANPRPMQQLMADLPSSRVTYTRPFYHTGVDYAGPIQYRPSVPRGAAQRRIGLLKGWISVFVCMSSKAVHLEFVTSLSTDAFIAAFRRFSARRTTPRHVYSDCGTNFEGAARELERLLQQEESQRQISDETRESGVIWHFNPPRAPHHGGLWEACVKSVKFHLSRIAQHTHMSYEELCTTLCQIEAILNSRPIGLTSENPNDLTYLTPGHFLTGTPGNACPDPNLDQVPHSRLSTWQLCQQQAQEFGKRFRLHYLNTLQLRSKWKIHQPNLLPNEIVLFLDEKQDGAKWVLGRIKAVNTGQDGRVRVVTVQTTRGLYTRPITKIARLPSREAEISCSNQSDDNSEHAGEDVQASTVNSLN